MKKMLVALFVAVLAVSAFGGTYEWEGAVINGSTSGLDDTTAVNAPGFSHPYGVAVAGNGRVWTHGMYGSDRYDAAIMIWDPEYLAVDTIGPEITSADGVTLDTLGSNRCLERTADGNIAVGDWTNDKIRVFDQDTYECIAESPGPDDPVFPNVGGGMATFNYDGEQYYLSQQILGSTVVLWDADFNVVDTLIGGAGGRNLAANEDGSRILAPGLGTSYLIEWTGTPDDGYVSDTVWLADMDVEIGNVMYVSSGPNDYFWIFSRDHANDGVLVCDPEAGYEVKLSTNTDSSITSVAGFDLGMAVDNQWSIWLAQGLIDSTDFYTTKGYQEAVQLRSPCQVDYSWAGGTSKEYLYLADYYGFTLKSWSRDVDDSVWEETGYIGENGFKLNAAYPNPFNPTATIPYALSADGHVAIEVFDLAGKKVATLVDGYNFAGNHEVVFNASDLASGNYLLKMTFDNKSVSQKISLVK